MFTFTVHPDGGEPFVIEAKSRAIAAWEKAPGSKGRSLGQLAETMRMTELVDLAWFAADKAGLTTLDRREWAEQVDVDVEKSDEDGEIPPTPPTR